MRRQSFLIEVLISLAFPTIVGLASYNFVHGDDANKWTIAYTLIGGIVSIIYLAFARFRYLSQKIDKMPHDLGSIITNNEIFKTNAIAQYLLGITENKDDLFNSLAFRKIRELRICLNDLQNQRYEALGQEVYDIYTQLIEKLCDGDQYWATTYIDDPFWDCHGGENFFKANKEAIYRGAKIIRVFLYDDSEKLKHSEVIKMHSKLVIQLRNDGLESQLELYKIMISKVNTDTRHHVAEDKGILMDTYVMNLESSSGDKQKALIYTSKDVVDDEKERFQNLLKHKDIYELKDEDLGIPPDNDVKFVLPVHA